MANTSTLSKSEVQKKIKEFFDEMAEPIKDVTYEYFMECERIDPESFETAFYVWHMKEFGVKGDINLFRSEMQKRLKQPNKNRRFMRDDEDDYDCYNDY